MTVTKKNGVVTIKLHTQKEQDEIFAVTNFRPIVLALGGYENTTTGRLWGRLDAINPNCKGYLQFQHKLSDNLTTKPD